MKNEMNDNFDVFDNYFMTYDINDKKIEYKYNHSYRVLHQSDEISFTLNLDEDDNYLACLIALLHDISRFRQWTKYKTYDDDKSFDHAQESNKILFDEGEIKKYKVNKDDYEIIKKAIFNHNKYKIDEEKLTVREKMHCNIIRDADKIDILYAFSEIRSNEIEEDNEKISDDVYKDFFDHKPILNEDIKNKNDRIVMLMALVYDLNYDYSKGFILDKGYIDKLYNNLNNKELFKPYYEEIIKYLKGSEKNA